MQIWLLPSVKVGISSSVGATSSVDGMAVDHDAPTTAEPESLTLPSGPSTTTTSVSIGSGAKRVAHADVKTKLEPNDSSKPPLEKKIKLEKK